MKFLCKGITAEICEFCLILDRLSNRNVTTAPAAVNPAFRALHEDFQKFRSCFKSITKYLTLLLLCIILSVNIIYIFYLHGLKIFINIYFLIRISL